MYLALNYYPVIEHQGFLDFREKYEPYASLLPAHLTFIFPLEESFGLANFKAHIVKVLEHWQPFDMHFCKLEKTWDHWLFLGAEEGNDKAIALHDELYQGPLKPYLREDLPYTPHIALGLFSEESWDFHNPTAQLTLDKDKYDKARREFESLEFELWFMVDQLTLVRLNDTFTKCDDIFSFRLN